MKSQSCKRPADVLWEANNTKRKKWKDQEILAMLNLIKKHSLLDHVPTDAQLGETLLKPLSNLGYARNAHQIKLKIKSLRKSYIQYRKGKLDSLKSCSFFQLLDSLYSEAESISDSESEEDSCEIEDDSIIWSESDLNRLLSVVKQLNLSHELSASNVSLKTLRLIHKSLHNANVQKSIDQIKILLHNLRNTYANYKKELANGFPSEKFPYFEQLDALWKREYANGRFQVSDGCDEFWSQEETILLLEALKEIDVACIDSENRDHFATKVKEFLLDSGYKRTNFQIVNKIDNLKRNYAAAKQCQTLDEAISKFPFYHQYETVFKINDGFECKGWREEGESGKQAQLGDDDYTVFEKKRHARGFIWVEEEVYTLLDLVSKLNFISIFRGRMTLDYVSQLVAPMAEMGFERTAWQIKIKLKGLRNQYYRCIQDNNTSHSAEDFIYFDKIHEMVRHLDQDNQNTSKRKKVTSSGPSKMKKKDSVLINIEVDEHDQSFGKQLDASGTSQADDSQWKNDTIVLWKPLESIPDVDDYDATLNEDESEMFEEISENEDNRLFNVATSPKYVDCSNPLFSNDKSEIHMENVENEGEIEIDDSKNVCYLKTESCSEDADCSGRYEKPGSQIVPVVDLSFGNEKDEANESSVGSQKVQSIESVLEKMLKQEESLQRQHQLWLEKQFEIQRKHDFQLKNELLIELRNLKSAIQLKNSQRGHAE